MHIFSLLMLLALSASSISDAKDASAKLAKNEKSGYPCPGKLIKNMNSEELEKVIAYAEERKDHELLVQTYNQLINHSQDHIKIKSYKLNLADFYFKTEDYAKASFKYEEFCILYPGSDESEYAQYKLILCTFYLSLSADRDQADTVKTINLTSLFLKRAKNEKFISETETIYKTCRYRLFEHEVLVMDTYLKQKKFTGAQKRLEYIQANFQDIPHLDQYMKYLQNIYDTVKDPKTRPFIFKVNLPDALVKKETKPVQPKDVAKAVSFFVA